jgi:hypothetical protein
MQIQVDERLHSHISPLKQDKYQQLDENILTYGAIAAEAR